MSDTDRFIGRPVQAPYCKISGGHTYPDRWHSYADRWRCMVCGYQHPAVKRVVAEGLYRRSTAGDERNASPKKRHGDGGA